WASDVTLPLLIRKQGKGRGESRVLRNSRELVQTDNSPAQWAFCQARDGKKPSIHEVRQMMEEKRIPCSFVKLQSCGIALNQEGWKLCHIDAVGLKTRTAIEDLPVEKLQTHFSLLMNPRNHFV